MGMLVLTVAKITKMLLQDIVYQEIILPLSLSHTNKKQKRKIHFNVFKKNCFKFDANSEERLEKY